MSALGRKRTLRFNGALVVAIEGPAAFHVPRSRGQLLPPRLGGEGQINLTYVATVLVTL
jgi:hypothetical protein